MTQKRLNRRNFLFIALTVYLFLFMSWTLYSAQIIYGQEYSQQSQRKIVDSQLVEVARGSILDKYGRVLVSNEVVYHLVLDYKEMGKNSTEIVTWLLDTAAEEETEWFSSLNISATAPFVFTGENVFYGTYENDQGEPYRVLTRLGEFCLEQQWIDDPRLGGEVSLSAPMVIDKMATYFGLEQYSLQEKRDISAVLYDLWLRQYEVRYDSYYFALNIDISFTSKVKERNYPGVNVVSATERVYGTEYAAHLLGRVSSMNTQEWEYYKSLDLGYEMDDKVGKEGAELAFEAYLRGEPGVRVLESNSQGNIMSAFWEIDPEPGGNVVLTLDIDLQKKVEDALASTIENYKNPNVQGGACVIVDVNSGSVLAAGSYPTFDLALYGEQLQENLENPLNPLFHRAFQGVYAPGSTFKMVTGIAALEEDIVEPSTLIRDDGPFRFYQDYSPACWIYNQYGGSHGNQNISDAIQNSCNYYFYQVGLELGISRIAEYAAMFGLGEASGIELPERAGIMAGPEYTQSMGGTWYDGATLSVAIGQESSAFTPLQLTNYIATLANGGIHYDAHLLQEVKSGDFSQVVFSYQPEKNADNLQFEEENVSAVLKGMRQLVTNGSIKTHFQTLEQMGIAVAAKTGTAQLTNTASDSANAVFVCYAPYDNPEVAMTIILEKGGSGGEAASLAAEILEYYFTSKENREEIRKENTLVH